MEWREEMIFIPKYGYRRAIVQHGEIIEFVDCLDKLFVKKIIDAHNKGINKTMEIWIKKGVEIAQKYAKGD